MSRQMRHEHERQDAMQRTPLQPVEWSRGCWRRSHWRTA